MSKAQHREQVREAWDPPFRVILGGASRDEANIPRPILMLDYGHASVQWQEFKNWVKTAPKIHYFHDEEGLGYYGTDEHDSLRMAVFVRNTTPNFYLFKTLVMKNQKLSVIAKTASFGHFELILLKDVDLYNCVGGVDNGELPNVDNAPTDPAVSQATPGS